MLASGDVIMCRYVLSMTGTETFQRQDSMSCIQHGMLKCQFNSNHKIVHAEVVFDVHGFMQQLQVSGPKNLNINMNVVKKREREICRC